MKPKTHFNKTIACLMAFAMIFALIPGICPTISAAPAGYTVIRLSDITPGTTYTISDDGNYWITGDGVTPANTSIQIGDIDGAPAMYTVVLDNAYISPKTASTAAGNYLSDWTGALRLTNGAMVNLYLNGNNTLLGTENTGPGIEVPENTYLTIDSYEESGSDKGTLYARPAKSVGLGVVGGAAGIGATGYSVSSGYSETVGSIAILGGTINATGYDGAAAIGGSTKGSTGSITIQGGAINAAVSSGIGAAAIGGGFAGTVASISISGGRIATKAYEGANIGAGTNTAEEDYVTVPNIFIGGGSILPVGSSKSIGYNNAEQLFTGGYVTITGGNVMAETILPAPTDGTNPLTAKQITLIGLDTETAFSASSFTGTITDKLTDYGTNDAVTLNPNKITLWLTEGEAEITSVTINDTLFEPLKNTANTFCAHSWQDSGYCLNCNEFDSAHAAPPALVDNYYQLKTANDLIWFAGYVNGDIDRNTHTSANAILVNDITLNENVLTDGVVNAKENLTQFVPIGKFYMLDGVEERVEYGGTFDGNGKTISGLYVNCYYNGKTGTRSGLFGMTSPSVVIKNLHVTDTYINGAVSNALTGIIAGYNHGLIENVHVTDSYATSYLLYVGGIAGYMSNSGTIRNCSVRSTLLTASTGTTKPGYAGGIVGCNYGGTVDSCYAVLTENSKATYLGGIAGIGNTATSFQNCYGVVTGSAGEYQGGIVGICDAYGSITNCYAENNGFVTKLVYKGTPTTDTSSALKDTEAFASGEVAYLLNNQNTDGVWKQTLGTDTYPNFSGASVYYNETDGYYNPLEILLEKESVALVSFSGNAILTVASYADGKLVDTRLIPVTGAYRNTLEAIGLNTNEANRIKAFLINDATSIKPLCSSKAISIG